MAVGLFSFIIMKEDIKSRGIYMDVVRYGIVGLGNQGTTYLKQFFLSGKVEKAIISAICDINPKRIEAGKELTKGLQVSFFEDYKELIDSGKVDAILVETPHYFHPEIAKYALERGVNVLCDKPAGVYVKQVRELNEAAKKSNSIFGMMFNQRTNCVYRKMREMIFSGELGKIQRLNWVITDWFRCESYYASGSWRATWDGEGGGVLINQCPHQIDLVSWIMGKLPSSVNGFVKYGRWHNIEVEDEVTAYFEYDDGATGTFITTTGEAPGTNRLEISGTMGKLICEHDELIFYKNDKSSEEVINNSEEPFGRPNTERIVVETDGNNPQHLGIIQNFNKAILKEESLFVDGCEGINGVELMNAIEYSGFLDGKKVSLPIDDDEYLRLLDERRKTSKKHEVKEKTVDTTGTY